MPPHLQHKFIKLQSFSDIIPSTISEISSKFRHKFIKLNPNEPIPSFIQEELDEASEEILASIEAKSEVKIPSELKNESKRLI